MRNVKQTLLKPQDYCGQDYEPGDPITVTTNLAAHWQGLGISRDWRDGDREHPTWATVRPSVSVEGTLEETDEPVAEGEALSGGVSYLRPGKPLPDEG